MADAEHDRQSEVLRFLGDSRAYGDGTLSVERIDTHAAVVLLAGSHAYKVKRAVKLPYLDFSTLEQRHAVLEREFALNRPGAPQLYLGLVPIRRGEEGKFSLDGSGGEIVEWALHMRRFPDDALLANHAARHGLPKDLVMSLAAAVMRWHEKAPVRVTSDGCGRLGKIVSQLNSAFSEAPDLVTRECCSRFAELSAKALERAARSLNMRAERGYIRRCHGDLHLSNIAVIDGEPVLFDALEFDEELATTDVMYDLAFLIMDMVHKGFRPAAQRLLNHYVRKADSPVTLYGLSALPLFLGLRAGIRALVAIDQKRLLPPTEEKPSLDALALAYLDAALDYFSPSPAKLVAIGGLSGTGKTTLAEALGHQFGAAPGALHLRSDVERKALFAVPETERLGPHGYTPEVTAEVYASIIQKAKIILRTGHSVIVDAVFAKPEERMAVMQIAERLQVPFVGLWLTAPAETMKARVAQRVGDASDATPEVVQRQLSYGTGPISWVPIDAGGGPDNTLSEARRVLGQSFGSLV